MTNEQSAQLSLRQTRGGAWASAGQGPSGPLTTATGQHLSPSLHSRRDPSSLSSHFPTPHPFPAPLGASPRSSFATTEPFTFLGFPNPDPLLCSDALHLPRGLLEPPLPGHQSSGETPFPLPCRSPRPLHSTLSRRSPGASRPSDPPRSLHAGAGHSAAIPHPHPTPTSTPAFPTPPAEGGARAGPRRPLLHGAPGAPELAALGLLPGPGRARGPGCGDTGPGPGRSEGVRTAGTVAPTAAEGVQACARRLDESGVSRWGTGTVARETASGCWQGWETLPYTAVTPSS